ncbi:hypothetical protein G9A89_009174 [Geosiphon pyriformis]|nr:hypothetical protein G9A89_009174 [Geosiphon pyriformis]
MSGNRAAPQKVITLKEPPLTRQISAGVSRRDFNNAITDDMMKHANIASTDTQIHGTAVDSNDLKQKRRETIDTLVSSPTIEKKNGRAQLVHNTEFGSNSRQNPVFVEWYGVNYSVSKKFSQDDDLSYENEKPAENVKRNKLTSWFWPFNKSIKKPNDIENPAKGSDGYKKIIENIHGCANPGILAIMGPSGCGKTTLLNLLGNRINKKQYEGTMLVNGVKLTKESKRFVAYCTQDDIFFPYLTVRETLKYTALLRLPREMSRQEKLAQVENVIKLLRLTKCADTIIGDTRVRGVSGGERKRVSIASELLTDPSVILLDEPTSGLDSSLALELVKILKEFALQQRKTIIMVIHQPSSQVFELFDKLLVMADGKMVYFDQAPELVNYLAREGFNCHANFNPADYLLDVLQDSKNRRKLINSYSRIAIDDPSGKQIVMKHSERPQIHEKQIPEIIPNSPLSLNSMLSSSDTVAIEDDTIGQPIIVKHRWEATFWQQLLVLTERGFKQRRKHIKDRYSLIYFTCIFWSFNPLFQTVSAFPLDREVLNKERQSRSYRLSAYFLAKTFAEVPLAIVSPSLFVFGVYWIANLLPSAGHFILFWLGVILTTITAQSFGYLFGAWLLDLPKALTSVTIFMLSSMLLAGFYVTYVPGWFLWASYLSFSKYSYQLLMQIQFDTPSARFRCSALENVGSQYSECLDNRNQTAYIEGHSVLKLNSLTHLAWYTNLFILVMICVMVRLAAYWVLRKTGTRK